MRYKGKTKKDKGKTKKVKEMQKNTNILTATQKVSKIPTRYGTPWFITVLTKANHWSVS